MSIRVIRPPDEIIMEFTRKVLPLFNHIQSNKYQSHSLAAIRDVLLPKLLSGEIKVKDAKKFVEANL